MSEQPAPWASGVNPSLRMGLGSPPTLRHLPHYCTKATGTQWALTVGEGDFFSINDAGVLTRFPW